MSGWGINANMKAAFEYARENENLDEKKIKTLDDQLCELNQKSESNIQWERQGDWIVPKSMDVARVRNLLLSWH